MNVARIDVIYSDVTRASVDLVSPYTMDVYYQHDAIGLNAVPYAKLNPIAWDTDWIWTGFVWEHCMAHADSLFLEIDASKTVDRLELSVCGSEVVLGLLAISIVE